jgi:hypothetical protein
MSRTFKSAGERISSYEDDFKDVWAVLAGDSVWIEHFRNNLPIAWKAAPHEFHFLNANDFARQGRKDTLGITNKMTGNITLLDISTNNAQFASMGAALHELVHLVSAPATQGKKITIFEALGEGLMEGLTQVVTEDILAKQHIESWSEHKYGARASIVRSLIALFKDGVGMFGRALFLGRGSELSPLPQRFGVQGFADIKTAATMHDLSVIKKIGKP